MYVKHVKQLRDQILELQNAAAGKEKKKPKTAH